MPSHAIHLMPCHPHAISSHPIPLPTPCSYLMRLTTSKNALQLPTYLAYTCFLHEVVCIRNMRSHILNNLRTYIIFSYLTVDLLINSLPKTNHPSRSCRCRYRCTIVGRFVVQFARQGGGCSAGSRTSRECFLHLSPIV